SSAAWPSSRRRAPIWDRASSWNTPWSAGCGRAFVAAACRRASSSWAAVRTEHWAAVVMALVGGAGPLAAQDPLSLVGPKTQVRSVEFAFTEKSSLDEDQLRQKIALSGQGGMVGLRRAFGWVPLVPPVGSHPFDPTEMAPGGGRLPRYYERSGFPKADVDYRATYEAKADVVSVTYRIAEGPPLTVDTLTFTGANGALTVPDSLGPSWQHFVRTARQWTARAGEDERRALADSTVRWFRANGYPFASAQTVARVDSAANRADLTVQVASGQRAKVRAIHTTGKLTVPEQEIVRQLPVRAGDW